MFTISLYQAKTMESKADMVFLHRVDKLLSIEQPSLWQSMNSEDKSKLLEEGLISARELAIVIEQDIYDFITLMLKHGKQFHLNLIPDIDMDWLANRNVPGHIKISSLVDALNTLASHQECMNEQY